MTACAWLFWCSSSSGLHHTPICFGPSHLHALRRRHAGHARARSMLEHLIDTANHKLDHSKACPGSGARSKQGPVSRQLSIAVRSVQTPSATSCNMRKKASMWAGVVLSPLEPYQPIGCRYTHQNHAATLFARRSTWCGDRVMRCTAGLPEVVLLCMRKAGMVLAPS